MNEPLKTTEPKNIAKSPQFLPANHPEVWTAATRRRFRFDEKKQWHERTS